jgi:hypothetical protein
MLISSHHLPCWPTSPSSTGPLTVALSCFASSAAGEIEIEIETRGRDLGRRGARDREAHDGGLNAKVLVIWTPG